MWKPVTNIHPKAIYQPPTEPTVTHNQLPMPPPNKPLPPLTPTQKHLLDIVPIQQQAHIQALFRSMSKALGNGVVASTKRERLRFWSAWQTWLAFNFPTVQPNLQQSSRSDQIELLAAFARHVQSGGVSTRIHQVHTQMVKRSRWHF